MTILGALGPIWAPPNISAFPPTQKFLCENISKYIFKSRLGFEFFLIWRNKKKTGEKTFGATWWWCYIFSSFPSKFNWSAIINFYLLSHFTCSRTVQLPILFAWKSNDCFPADCTNAPAGCKSICWMFGLRWPYPLVAFTPHYCPITGFPLCHKIIFALYINHVTCKYDIWLVPLYENAYAYDYDTYD